MPAATSSASVVRIQRTLSAPSLARRYLQRELSAPMAPACLSEIILLTSELVANAVEHASTDQIELTVVDGPSVTRIEVSSPGNAWGGRPRMQRAHVDDVGGRGLFLVDRLSDRWGIREDEASVWFELDHYAPGL